MTAQAAGLTMMILLITTVPGAFAQPAGDGRVEVGAGAVWIRAIDFGHVRASETTLGGGTSALFATDTSLDQSIGATGAVGVRLTPQLVAEAGVAYSPTSLTTRVTFDTEGIPDTKAHGSVTQFLISAGIRAQPTSWRGRRLSPFLTAGAGYLRQLNDGRTLVETGHAYYVGGGLSFERAASGRRRTKAMGVRIDARGVILQGGVAPDDTARTTLAVSAMLFARF